ncbi:MAG: hypothetical protein HOQ35_21535 [Acidobacteriaceae bacterium]|nr:hypothetical protein [Acidobacteriaceae bacterium]
MLVISQRQGPEQLAGWGDRPKGAEKSASLPVAGDPEQQISPLRCEMTTKETVAHGAMKLRRMGQRVWWLADLFMP